MLLTFFIYAVVGVIAGFFAGLLGIGGGLVIVPALIFCFNRFSIDQSVVLYLALGTSMGCILFTSISSCLAHHRRGAVNWEIVKKSAIGVFIGTFGGTYLATLMSTLYLKLFLVIFLYSASLHMLLGGSVRSSYNMPNNYGLFGVASIVGLLSSLVGIGGGTFSVPLLEWSSMRVHNAVATSAAIGFPIAVAGTLGYMWRGFGASGLPTGSVGYVYFPALIGIVCFSLITTDAGAKMAHSLPINKLKRIFAVLLLVVATKMLATLF